MGFFCFASCRTTFFATSCSYLGVRLELLPRPALSVELLQGLRKACSWP